MSHTVYKLKTNAFITNVHTILTVMREALANKHKSKKKYAQREAKLEELQQCWPGVDKDAAENLLDGFYVVHEDGSVSVDNIPWGRR